MDDLRERIERAMRDAGEKYPCANSHTVMDVITPELAAVRTATWAEAKETALLYVLNAEDFAEAIEAIEKMEPDE